MTYQYKLLSRIKRCLISDSLKSPNDDEDYQEGSGDATTEPQKVTMVSKSTLKCKNEI